MKYFYFSTLMICLLLLLIPPGSRCQQLNKDTCSEDLPIAAYWITFAGNFRDSAIITKTRFDSREMTSQPEIRSQDTVFLQTEPSTGIDLKNSLIIMSSPGGNQLTVRLLRATDSLVIHLPDVKTLRFVQINKYPNGWGWDLSDHRRNYQ